MIIKVVYSVNKNGYVKMSGYSSEDMSTKESESKAIGLNNIATSFARLLREFPSTYEIVGEKEIRQSCSCGDLCGLLNSFRKKGYMVDEFLFGGVGMIYIYGGSK